MNGTKNEPESYLRGGQEFTHRGIYRRFYQCIHTSSQSKFQVPLSLISFSLLLTFPVIYWTSNVFQEFKSPWRFSTESGRVDGKGILSAAKEWAIVKQVLCTFWTSQDSCLSELSGHWIEKEHDSCPRHKHLFLSLFLFASGCTLCKEKRDLEYRKGSQMNFITMYLKRSLLGISLQNVQFFISNNLTHFNWIILEEIKAHHALKNPLAWMSMKGQPQHFLETWPCPWANALLPRSHWVER